MNKEEIKDILEELHLVRPEILKPKAKKLFEAIMSIADERDELQQENKKYKEVIDKVIEYLEPFVEIDMCTIKGTMLKKPLEILKGEPNNE